MCIEYIWLGCLLCLLHGNRGHKRTLRANQRDVSYGGCADDYAHITQTGFFFTIKGSKKETVVYCGDRWPDFAGNGLGYNQWFPLSFDGKTPHFNLLRSWKLDAGTGEWEVAADNNYAKNGSFEADRKNIQVLLSPCSNN